MILTAPPNSSAPWRKGGMSCNGLRASGEVWGYIRTPGRPTILPDAPKNAYAGVNGVSSVGQLQSNNLKQITSSIYGPGSLLSSNIEVRSPQIAHEAQRGAVMQNDKRTQFVDYRHTDPTLVRSLKENPLSIFVNTESKNHDIPAFFSYIRPDNYSTYTSEPNVEISNATIIRQINGSPNVSLLGLGEQNPLMGITVGIPNEYPEFLGKTYGGDNSGNAKKYAMEIYKQADTPEGQNEALHYFSPGYNIANQVRDGKMVQYLGSHNNRPQTVTNLPWGPIKVTNNPFTQQGGIWQKGQNPWPVLNQGRGSVQTNTKVQIASSTLGVPYKPANCDNYTQDPGFSIICSN